MTAPEPPGDVVAALAVHAPVQLAVQVGRMVVRLPRHPLPVPVHGAPRLVGRDAPRRAVATLLADGRAGVVLVGPPGSGTSALALAAARDTGRHALWLDARAAPEVALTTALRLLGVPRGAVPADPDGRRGLYRTALASAPSVVVLDDAADPATVRLLAPGSGTPTIVTARTPMPGLAVDGWAAVRVDPLVPHDAEALLHGAGWPRDGTAAAVAVRCGGRPRALRLAAASWATGVAVHAVLDTTVADPVEAAVRAAVTALPPEAARLWEILVATGAHTVPVGAAAALTGTDEATARRVLDLLAARGLLDVDPYGEGYRSWAPVSPGRRVRATGRPDPVLAPSADTIAAGPDGSAAESALELAAAALERTGDAVGEAGVRLRLGETVRHGGRAAAALGHASAALALSRVAGDAAVTGGALTLVAHCLLDLGEPAAAFTVAGRACRAAPAHGPDAGRALLVHGMAAAATGLGAQARASLRAAADRFTATRHTAGTVEAWRRLAEHHLTRGQRTAALAAYRRGLLALADRPEAVALLQVLDGEAVAQVVGGTPARLVTVALADGSDEVAELLHAVERALDADGRGEAARVVRVVTGLPS